MRRFAQKLALTSPLLSTRGEEIKNSTGLFSSSYVKRGGRGVDFLVFGNFSSLPEGVELWE